MRSYSLLQVRWIAKRRGGRNNAIPERTPKKDCNFNFMAEEARIGLKTIPGWSEAPEDESKRGETNASAPNLFGAARRGRRSRCARKTRSPICLWLGKCHPRKWRSSLLDEPIWEQLCRPEHDVFCYFHTSHLGSSPGSGLLCQGKLGSLHIE